jgi:hypothetical protein
MATAKKNGAIFIGASQNVQDRYALKFDVTITASNAPQYPRKHGTPEQWAETCKVIRETALTGESPVIGAALDIIELGKYCTVYVDTLAFGISAPAGSRQTWDQYPTVTDPDGWRQVVSIARASACMIINL